MVFPLRNQVFMLIWGQKAIFFRQRVVQHTAKSEDCVCVCVCEDNTV